MSLKPNPKPRSAAEQVIDPAAMNRFVSGAPNAPAAAALSPAPAAPRSKPILVETLPSVEWDRAAGVTAGKPKQVAARLPEEINAMLDWLSKNNVIKSKMNLIEELVSKAARDLVYAEVQEQGVDRKVARKLANIGKR